MNGMTEQQFEQVYQTIINAAFPQNWDQATRQRWRQTRGGPTGTNFQTPLVFDYQMQQLVTAGKCKVAYSNTTRTP
jgi:hypothetical protein